MPDELVALPGEPVVAVLFFTAFEPVRLWLRLWLCEPSGTWLLMFEPVRLWLAGWPCEPTGVWLKGLVWVPFELSFQWLRSLLCSLELSL